ncbi:MAG: aspartate--tRNA ligase [Mycoplasmatales bacterium]
MMRTPIRTEYLGQLSSVQENKQVTLCGWVKKSRNLGELLFIDLRDITGYAQLVVTKENQDLYDQAANLKNEYVIQIFGTIKLRKDPNPEIPTGQIEVIVEELNLINEAKVLPMVVDDETDGSEETRMQYRFLDLRRPVIQNNLIVRSKVTTSVRNFLTTNNFLEIETPMLTKSTPEGARDYLVPSRVNPGNFYALPQSPQIYKNLLMLGGLDRYFQIVKCFRDEDLRSDRQPEFTQIDMEMSFMSETEIREITEKMLKQVLVDVMGQEVTTSFPIMSYDDAMNSYGLDKPDIRFDLKINDVKTIFQASEFKVFAGAEYLRCLVVKDAADKYSRKEIEKLEVIAKTYQAKGLAWLKYEEELTGPIAKFLSDGEKQNLIEQLKLTTNDLILFVADEFDVVCAALGNLRNHLGRELKLYNETELAFVWVVNWPMFEYNEEFGRYIAMHHPFTMPVDDKFNDEVLTTYAQAYDIVLNGYEIGGGSIRINNSELQRQMFKHLGMDEKEYEKDFGFYLDAYEYGAPYHGGIALGLDRLVMLLTNMTSIKEVIAFPKNSQARDVLMDAPSIVEQEQLDELAVCVVEKN